MTEQQEETTEAQVDYTWSGSISPDADHQRAVVPALGDGPTFVMIDHQDTDNCARVTIRSHGPVSEAAVADYLEIVAQMARHSADKAAEDG